MPIVSVFDDQWMLHLSFDRILFIGWLMDETILTVWINRRVSHLSLVFLLELGDWLLFLNLFAVIVRVWLDVWVIVGFKVMILITVLDNQRSPFFISPVWRKNEANIVLGLVLNLEANWLVDLPNVHSGCGLILGIFQGGSVFGISYDSLQTQGGLDSHRILLEVWFLGLNCDLFQRWDLDCTVLSLDNSRLSGNFLESILLLLGHQLVGPLLF